MAVLRVKKATIVAERSAQAKLLEALQAFGGFELTDLRDVENVPRADGQVVIGSDDITAKNRVRQALDILTRYEKPRSGIVETFVDVKWSMSLAQYKEFASQDYLSVVARVDELDARLATLRDEHKRTEARIQQLTPLRGLTLPLEAIRPTASCNVLLGSVPVAALAALEAALAEVDTEHHETVGEDGRNAHLLIAYLQDDARVQQILAASAFVPASFPDITGVPVHCLQQLEKQLADVDTEIAAIEAELSAIAADDIQLKAVYDGFVNSEQRLAAHEQALNTPHLLILEGWVSSKRVDGLSKAVESACPTAELALSDPAEGDAPPTVLDNNSVVEPFEMVTQIYGAPSYTEMDPTPWLAPFFALFFGTALGDAGYGLLMGVFFLIGIKKWFHLTWGGKRMNRLMILIGLASIAMGVLTGSFFGDLTKYLPFPALDALRARYTLIDPMANPLGMMGVSLAMGVVQVYTGVIAKFVSVVRGGSLKDAILDQGMWLMYLGGFILYGIAAFGVLPASLAPVFKYIGMAGVLGILVFAGRANRNPLARLGIGLYGLYGTINYVADVLSYSRLLALGLSGTVIAVVVNQLGFMAGSAPIIGIPIIVVILAIGHLFNIAISAFGAFIHCARLQFVEYFSKFYEGSGRYIDPLRWRGRYTLIREYTE